MKQEIIQYTIVAIIILAAVVWLIVRQIRNRKNGNSCGCGCSGCALSDSCNSKNLKKRSH